MPLTKASGSIPESIHFKAWLDDPGTVSRIRMVQSEPWMRAQLATLRLHLVGFVSLCVRILLVL